MSKTSSRPLASFHARLSYVTAVRISAPADSPAETSDFCRPELWRVRRSRLLLICSSSLWGCGFSCADSSSPSGFHVLNWKRVENPPVADAADGSDRKLLPELRKVQATSWGCAQEKVTLPWRTTNARTGKGFIHAASAAHTAFFF